jgi:hypothetical protein
MPSTIFSSIGWKCDILEIRLVWLITSSCVSIRIPVCIIPSKLFTFLFSKVFSFSFYNGELLSSFWILDNNYWRIECVSTRMRFYGVAVSTLDFESSDPSSNLGRTCHKIFVFFRSFEHFLQYFLLKMRLNIWRLISTVCFEKKNTW